VAPVYDRIGESYARGRRADPQIEQPIWAALGGARTVLNVGAGGGSYEPTGSTGAYWQRPCTDLDSGAWDQRWGHLLGLAELDLGYCVAVTR
jgi:hypothetical protein